MTTDLLRFKEFIPIHWTFENRYGRTHERACLLDPRSHCAGVAETELALRAFLVALGPQARNYCAIVATTGDKGPALKATFETNILTCTSDENDSIDWLLNEMTRACGLHVMQELRCVDTQTALGLRMHAERLPAVLSTTREIIAARRCIADLLAERGIDVPDDVPAWCRGNSTGKADVA